MAADHKILGDPPATEWDEPFTTPVDGVWLLAGEACDLLHHAVGRVHAWLRLCRGQVRGVEASFHWRPEPGKRWACREPFGFADGISNPEFVAGAPANHWSVDLGLDRVLIEDAGLHQGGSFFVVRKLEQNVAAFRAFEAKLAAELRESLPSQVGHEAARLAEAALIGRDREGLPLADLAGDGLNDFSFTSDGRAARCPFHAHIRKANPRDDNPYASAIAMEDARKFQFVRRSMVYGDPTKLTMTGPDWPTGGVGLWFMGYMRDIEEQFCEMQGRWMRDRYFPGHNRDALPDPLLFGGMTEGGEPATTWRWAREGQTTCVPGLAQFVRPRGGEYFYVPSLRWLAAGGCEARAKQT
jgi:Dyp-type peroxidase family